MIYNNKITLLEKVRMVAYYVFCNDIYSTMKIQRYFALHYITAMTIVEILEILGIVSEFDIEARCRKVLVNNIEELERKLDFYF